MNVNDERFDVPIQVARNPPEERAPKHSYWLQLPDQMRTCASVTREIVAGQAGVLYVCSDLYLNMDKHRNVKAVQHVVFIPDDFDLMIALDKKSKGKE